MRHARHHLASLRSLLHLIPVLLAALLAPSAMAQTGACCFSGGACVEITALECIQFGGDYQGNGSTCGGANCDPTPTGACCMIDGTCSVVTASQCSASGGLYQGNGQACTACPDCPGEGLCYVENGSPGCNSAACCNVVCDADSFCCLVEWDSLCVDEALDLCGNCGSATAGDCFGNNGSPGCDDSLCCATVCAADPFCCNTFWDSTCASQAIAMCVQCGDAGTGDCMSANGSPYCDDAACCEAVCANDSSCCSSVWDATCATIAAALCDPCPWDCGDDDGVVGVVDLLALLSAWGSIGVSCDIGLDGIGTSDLLDLIANWGPCPMSSP